MLKICDLNNKISNVGILLIIVFCLTTLNSQNHFEYSDLSNLPINNSKDSIVLSKVITYYKYSFQNCISTTPSNEILFVSYNFYALKKHNTPNSTDVLEHLKEKIKKSSLIDDLAACYTQTTSNTLSSLETICPIEEDVLKHNIKKQIQKALSLKISKLELLNIDTESLQIMSNALKSTIQKTINEKENQSRKFFIDNAIAIGLPKNKTEKLLNLMEQRQKDINDFDFGQKQKIHKFSLLEPEVTKTPVAINRIFKKNIASVITFKEYSKLVKNQLKPNVIKQTRYKLKEIMQVHNLTKTQRKTLYKKIKLYNYNKAFVINYYSFNNNELKSKLSVLDFYFRKEYKNIMSSFNLKVDNIQLKQNNQYAW